MSGTGFAIGSSPAARACSVAGSRCTIRTDLTIATVARALRPGKGTSMSSAVVGAGSVLSGRYRLVEPLATGGMGTVWRALDLLLDRPVAVKEVRLPPGLDDAERELLRRRTIREAQVAARLRHAAIVTIFDVVEQDGRPWIVMELVPSPSLAQAVRDAARCRRIRVAEIGLRVLDATSRRDRGRRACTATSSRRTSWSRTTAGSCSPTSASPAVGDDDAHRGRDADRIARLHGTRSGPGADRAGSRPTCGRSARRCTRGRGAAAVRAERAAADARRRRHGRAGAAAASRAVAAGDRRPARQGPGAPARR